MTYKIGELVGHNTVDGMHLCMITGIYYPSNKNLCKVCLTVKVLYDEDLNKPLSEEKRDITLPQQKNEVFTFNEYIEIAQSKINEKQNVLSKIKELNE